MRALVIQLYHVFANDACPVRFTMAQMLGSLKGILHKVQHDSNSQRQKLAKKLENTKKRIRKRLSSKQTSDEEEERRDSELSYDPDAGAGLLLRYQQVWAEMRTNSSNCAANATRVDERLQSEVRRCQALHNAFTAFNWELSRIPDLMVILGEAKTRVEDVNGQLKVLEKQLDELEDICNDLEVKQKKEAEALAVKRHSEQKWQQLEREKVAALRKYTREQEALQFVEMAAIEEKRQAYQEVFAEQMQLYKKQGKVDLPIGHSKVSQDKTLLEDMSLDEQDAAELNEFLKDLSPVLSEDHEDGDGDSSLLSPEVTSVDEDDDETVPVMKDEESLSPPVGDSQHSQMKGSGD